jgi:hypothetical protein
MDHIGKDLPLLVQEAVGQASCGNNALEVQVRNLFFLHILSVY